MGRPRKVEIPDSVDDSVDDLDPDSTADIAPDALDQIQALLKTVSPGYRIQVWRQAPREFRGLLEEIEVTDGQAPLDLQYLSRTWGGKELRIKIRNKKGQYKGTYDIPLYSHPPLFWGKPIPSQPPPSYGEPISSPFYPSAIPAPPSPPGIGANLAELLGVLQRYKSTESELLASLINRTAAPPPPVASPSPFESLNQAIELIGRLQALTPAPAPAPASGSFSGGETDADSLVPHITRLIEMFLTRQERTAAPPSAPPRTARAAPAPLNGNDILQSLAQADPKDLAGVYRGVLAELPRNQRLAAIEAFEAAFEAVEPDLFKDDAQDENETEESEKPGIG